MKYSSRDAGPGLFQGASYTDASNGIFNQAGRDQYIYYPTNNEIIADAYLDKLPRAMSAGFSSGNHKACLKGTREGVLQEIETWELDKMNESVYWLKGVAGCGKSTIAKTFAERSAASGKLGASFFCSRDYPDRRNLHLIFSTIAYDLAYWRPDFKIALVPIIRSNPNVQYDALPVQLEKLLVRPFKQTGLSATIVVDALDECEDLEPVSEFLSALALHVGSMPTVKFFITGRPEDRIRSGFKLPSLRTKELPLHDVDSVTVDSDIESFLKTSLGEVASRRRHSISGQWPSDQDIATILKKTAGLFIIAAVIVRFIDSPFASPQKRIKLIVDMPNSTIYEGKSIDVVYRGILSVSLEDAEKDDPDFLNQLRLVVGSIVLALKPLPRATLADILEMTSENIWNLLTHLHSVLIMPESPTEPIRILHKSFADFITNNQRCPDRRYSIDASAHHSVLGEYCLKLMESRLTKNICRLPRYVMNDDVNDLPARRESYIGSSLSYACSSWAKHLQLSSKVGANSTTIRRLLNDFFTHHLLSWLEVLSTEANFHIAIYSLHDVRSWLTDSPNKGLLDLIADCERFILRSFDGMEQSAMHIYHSALLWTPTSSLTRKLYEHELMAETKLLNAVGTAWDACIRIIPVGKEAEAPVFSHDGALIVAYGECFVKVFDAMTGVNRVTVDEAEPVVCVAFSPDNNLLASALQDGNMNIWDIRTGTLFQAFQAFVGEAPHRSVAFSPCGTMIASSSDRSHNIRIRNISSGFWECVLPGHLGGVKAICWPAAGKQVISVSGTYKVRIWDVQRETCSKISPPYRLPLTVACSTDSILAASTDGVVNVFDSQSHVMIQTISVNRSLTHSRFSIDGNKILLASRNSGCIWDLASETGVWNIDYDGDHATFSPDGTCVASIYGKFLKMWKTTAESKHHKPSSHLGDKALKDICISPDEQLVATKFKNGAQILDATTGLPLFTFADAGVKLITFSANCAFVACLIHYHTESNREYGSNSVECRRVDRWNTHSWNVDKSMKMDNVMFQIALSSNGSRLVCLSPYSIKLFDLEGRAYLANWRFPAVLDSSLQGETRVSFTSNGMGISIKNSDITEHWDILRAKNNNKRNVSSLPMVFRHIGKESTNQAESVQSQAYCFGQDDEWILDRHGKCVLWIPPDERPRRSQSFRCERKIVVETEGGKVYIVEVLVT